MKISVYGNTHYAWVMAAKLAQKGHLIDFFLPEDNDTDINAFDVKREWQLPELLAEQKYNNRFVMKTKDQDVNAVHILADDYTEQSLTIEIHELYEKFSRQKTDYFIYVVSAMPLGLLQKIQDEVNKIQDANNIKNKFYIAAMPLFIREGRALADFERPQLFLLGSSDEAMINYAKDFMRPFIRQASEVMFVSVADAEFIKFSINAMLATRISFMNEMAVLAEKLGVDIELVRQGMAADPRVGKDYLQPGCGFGGPSFSHDLLSFAKSVKDQLNREHLLETVININDYQKEIIFRKIWRYFKGQLKDKKVAVWGCAFKPGTSSVSNSVAHATLQSLWAQGCKTVVYDPQAMDSLLRVYPNQPLLILADTAMDAVQDADALAILTLWDEFNNPDFNVLKSSLKNPLIFDGRNIYDPEHMKKIGIHYFAVGRGEQLT